MITELESCKVGYVIGVRYRKTFTVADNLGAIVDNILQSKQSKFKARIFPYIQHTDRDEDVLFDFENNIPQNKLTINTSNIVLDVQNMDKISFKDGIEAFRDTIFKYIMHEYSIGYINRIGFINRYIIKDKDIIDKFIKGTVGRGINDVNDINLQFSKRLPLTESLVKQGVDDYHNVIVNIIKKNAKEELFLSVDYQLYYSPMLEKASQIDFDRFLKNANDYIQKHLLGFLNNTYGVDGNA